MEDQFTPSDAFFSDDDTASHNKNEKVGEMLDNNKEEVQAIINNYIEKIKEGGDGTKTSTYAILETALFGELYIRRQRSMTYSSLDNIGIRQIRTAKEARGEPDDKGETAKLSWADQLQRHLAAFGDATYATTIKKLKREIVQLPTPILAFLILYFINQFILFQIILSY